MKAYELTRLKILVLFLCLGLAHAVHSETSDTQANQKFLRDFVLLDEHEEALPAREPESKKAPFGALVVIVDGKKTYCTATHLSDLTVATNAHCLEKSSDPDNYFLVYYQKDGTKAFAPVVRFLFKGTPRIDDVAFLEISPEKAKHWDEAGNSFLSMHALESRIVPYHVTIWAFDPIRFYPKLVEKFGKYGAVFKPKTCFASRNQPHLFAGYDHTPKELFPIGHADAASDIHWYYDGCSETPVPGNSGALVTLGEAFTQKIGLHHMTVAPTEVQEAEYDFFYYRGIKKDDTLRYDELPEYGLYGEGTLFDLIDALAEWIQIHQRPI